MTDELHGLDFGEKLSVSTLFLARYDGKYIKKPNSTKESPFFLGCYVTEVPTSTGL